MRQYGNLSYIRTYQAGHAIPSFQPETAYKIFTRVLFNLDIATGTQSTAGTDPNTTYKSTGREDPNVQLQATGPKLTYCYTYDISSCYEWQQDAILNGTAEICQWIFVDANSTRLFPDVIAKCRAEWGGQDGGNETKPGQNGSYSGPVFEGAATTVGVYSWAMWWTVVALTVVGGVL